MSLDYRDFNGQKKAEEKPTTNKWWAAQDAHLANDIHQIVTTLANNDKGRAYNYQLCAALYGNAEAASSGSFIHRTVSPNPNALKERIAFNVVSSAVDTLTAKIAKNRPKPLFLTSGGNYKVQRKARKLTAFVDGIFYAQKAYDLGALCFRDACIYNTGVVHVFDQDGEVKYERVLPSELFTDPIDSYYGQPRQLHRVKAVDREVLIEAFPDFADKIRYAEPASSKVSGAMEGVSDLVVVIESWHLPSGKDATDGRHVLSIANQVLADEEWTESFFPFAFLHYNKPIVGLWGQSLAQQLKPIQLELNKLYWVIARSMHLAGTFKIWMPIGAMASTGQFSNEIATIIESEQAPQYLVPPIVQPEIYQHIGTLKNNAFEMAGISQLQAASLKPSGLNSGAALREYNDISTDRFAVTGQNYEQFYLDLAKLTVWKARKLYEDNKKLQVTVAGKKFIQSIQWKDVNLEDDEFVLQIFPISSLPSDPAGRLAQIQEYMQAGLLTPREGRRLIDFPDLGEIEDLANASEDYLRMIIEKIIDEGEYTPPDDTDDLQLAAQLINEYIAQSKRDGVEEDKLELLRSFKDQVQLLISKAASAQAAQAQSMAGKPMAAPMPTPQSELLPNTA
jgi:hypothetical protein